MAKIINPIVIPNSLRIYTDGSAVVKNNRPGGWGVYITDGNGYENGFKGKAIETTVSRMEMVAMRVALDFGLSHWNINNQKIMIYSDSQMVVRSINNGWLKQWQRENFHNRVNSDIWIDIFNLWETIRKTKVNLTITHIRGHQKNLDNPHVFGNCVADGLADYKANHLLGDFTI